MKLIVMLLILLPLTLYPFLNDRPLNQYVMKNWSTADGLPQNSIIASVETRDGFIWLGTEEGLVRFDGTTFKIFNKRHFKTKHHYIVSIKEDPVNPYLWVATASSGLIRFNYLDHTIKLFHQKDGFPVNHITILKISGETLWIGTGNRGLCGFDLKRETVQKCYTRKDGLDSDKITSLQRYGPNHFIAIAGQSTLFHFKNGIFTKMGLNLPKDITLSGLKIDRDHNLWITSYNRGVFKVSGEVITPIAPEIFQKFPTNGTFQDRSGGIWIISKERGIFRLDRNLHPGKPLNIGIPFSMREDRKGNLWINTLSNGFYRLSPGIFRSYTSKNGLKGAPVYPILQQRNNTFLLGSFSGGVQQLNKNHRITPYQTASGEKITRSATSIIETRSGTLWLFLFGKGLLQVLKDGTTRVFSTQNGLPANTGIALIEDRKGNIWGNSNKGEIFKIAPDLTISTYQSTDKIDLHHISAIAEDHNGRIWFGTGKGVIVFNGTQFKPFLPGKITGRILSITHYSDLSILSGYHGIYFYKNSKLSHLGDNSGLTANTIFAAILDRYQRLWFTSNRGVFSIEPDQLALFMKTARTPKINSYALEDGLSALECAGGTQYNLIMDRSGQIWFPTLNGVSVINPEQLLSSPPQPRLTIDYLLLDQQKKGVTPGETITITPEIKWLTIPVNTITHHIPRSIRYRYRISGYDQQWFPLKDHQIRLSALPRGNYQLEISATDARGNWLPPITLPLHFSPHLYETLPFYLVIVPLTLFLMILLVKWRIRSVIRENQRLETLVTARTQEIKELALKDPLTGLRNRRYVEEVIKPQIINFLQQKQYQLAHKNHRNPLLQEQSYALFLLDIDHFKQVNDLLGHDAGDRVLKQFATLIQSSIREEDFAIRWGGEEFLIILKDTRADQLNQFAEKLKGKIIETPLIINDQGETIFKTVSGGFLPLPLIPEQPEMITFEQGIILADQGLYHAKEHGRNQLIAIQFHQVIPLENDLPGYIQRLEDAIESNFIRINTV